MYKFWGRTVAFTWPFTLCCNTASKLQPEVLMNCCQNSQVVFCWWVVGVFGFIFKSVIRKTPKKAWKEWKPLYLQGTLLSSGVNLKLLLLAKEQDLKRNCNSMTLSVLKWRNGWFFDFWSEQRTSHFIKMYLTTNSITFGTKGKSV